MDKKRSTPQNACKKQQQQTRKLKLTKQRASSEGETFTISEENCLKKKESWTVLKRIKKVVLYFNRLSNNYLKSFEFVKS